MACVWVSISLIDGLKLAGALLLSRLRSYWSALAECGHQRMSAFGPKADARPEAKFV